MNLGLKENNYPIKEIELIMNVPVVQGKIPEVVSKVDFNNMTHYDIDYHKNSENPTLQLKFTNEPNEENKISWIKNGSEKVVLTYIYDSDVVMPDEEISIYKQKVTLYNSEELKCLVKGTIDNLDTEELVSITENATENVIYKGKLLAGIDRQYETKTNIGINLANAEQYIKINEEEAKYLLEDEQELSANTIFNKTVINKKAFDEILGEDGQITISNGQEIIATINKHTNI